MCSFYRLHHAVWRTEAPARQYLTRAISLSRGWSTVVVEQTPKDRRAQALVSNVVSASGNAFPHHIVTSLPFFFAG